MSEMDTTEVFMVRSAKGYDMLCVDNYLFHYEDRGLNSYRWVCNRRKDKLLPCRSRIITTVVDGDETKHVVQKVVGDHTHDKCTAGEISKAFERKRVADRAGEPCTLEHKAEKRRMRRMEEFEETIRRDMQTGERGLQRKTDDGNEENSSVKDEHDSAEEGYDDEVVWADWLQTEDELQQETAKSTARASTSPAKKVSGKAASTPVPSSDIKGFHFKKEQLYMLKMPNGRQLVCLDGLLYRLEGKSPTSGTYRWLCVRRQLDCSTRLHTVRLPNGTHKVRQTRGLAHTDAHTHQPYTSQQLRRVMLENNMSLMNGQTKGRVDNTSTTARKSVVGGFEEVTYSPEHAKELSVNEIIEECDGVDAKSVSEDTLEITLNPIDGPVSKKRKVAPVRKMGKKSTARKTAETDISYELVEDPLVALNEACDSPLNVKKFTFLPSAKGNKVLCLDNFIYHYDSRSQSNGRTYWTCILRRDKTYKCNGRITTEASNGGTAIVKVSGMHRHPDSSEDIRRRLYKSVVARKVSEANLKPSEVLNSSMTELGDDFKRIVAKSKETIERRIGRLRMKLKKDKLRSAYEPTLDEQNESSSSFSSALESDDEKFEFANLPSNLEEMREHISNEHLAVADQFTEEEELQCESEEYEVEDTTPMDEENYVESTYFGNDDDSDDEELDTSNDHILRTIDSKDITPVFKRGRKRRHDVDNIEPDMDINKVSTLRSAKGGELLCVDGYIYHMKSAQNTRTYWTCIKCKDRHMSCKSRVATMITNDGIKVFKVTNHHSHPVNEQDLKRRLYNELTKGIPNVTLKPKQVLQRSLHELSAEYAELFANSKGSEERHQQRINATMEEIPVVELAIDEDYEGEVLKHEVTTYNIEFYGQESNELRSIMKLYAVSDGPPSLAVRMTLKALKIPYELVNVDYCASEHLSEEYAKMNPQKEIPVLDDNGFYLPESIAIMQYLCDKYAAETPLYPKDATQRAVINHRLCFNMGFYYSSISGYVMAPIFFDYQRTEMGLKKVNTSLSVFETYLERAGTRYAAADCLTIADFALVSATICLEAIGFDLSPYPLVKKWYETFKEEYPELWEIANGGMQEITEFEKNPPDLSHMNHPFHPTRKTKA